MKPYFLYLVLVCCLFNSSCLYAQSSAPQPDEVIPSTNQLRWQDMEYYMFAHFGPNTFTGREWGTGKEDPQVFNPTNLNCFQWARIAKSAGMKAIILVIKHHDGFCLWPSKFSTHTVAYSRWQHGRGNVLRDLSVACKAYGLKLGIYISPWDRNHPAYGTAAYNQVFAGMLKEVLTGYGPIFEVWFDGANGEGPNGKKQIYDWALFDSTVKKYQPQAVIFNFSNTDGIRWVGNENGFSTSTSWSRDSGFQSDARMSGEQLSIGLEDGPYWRPTETDVSIRPGWFYHPEQDSLVKSVAELMKIYEGSEGRNSSLLLNVPPDRDGLISPADSARLVQFHESLKKAFGHNLALDARIEASNTRGKDPRYSPRLLVDGNPHTWWMTDDSVTQADITLNFTKPVTFNTLVLMEYLPLGQRIRSFSVETWNGKEFEQIDSQTTIGHKRILTYPDNTTTRIRIHIKAAAAGPVLSEIQVFEAPAIH